MVKTDNQPKTEVGGTIVCPKCGKPFSMNRIFCEHCERENEKKRRREAFFAGLLAYESLQVGDLSAEEIREHEIKTGLRRPEQRPQSHPVQQPRPTVRYTTEEVRRQSAYPQSRPAVQSRPVQQVRPAVQQRPASVRTGGLKRYECARCRAQFSLSDRESRICPSCNSRRVSEIR